MWLAFRAASAHYWLISNFFTHQCPQIHLSAVLSLVSALNQVQHLVHLPCWSSWGLHRLLFELVEAPGVRVSAASLSLVSSANLLWMHSIPLCRSLMNVLNNFGPSINPQGTPLITGLHLDIEPLTAALWIYLCTQFLINLILHLSSTYLANLEVIMLWGGFIKGLTRV